MAVDLFRNNAPVLHATMGVPVALSLFSAERLNAPIHGVIRADSADLAVIETLSPSLQKGSGSLTANLEYSLSRTHKSINGLIAVRNGQVTAQNLGITLRAINGSVRFDGRSDSVRVDLAAVSGTQPGARLALRGSVSYAKWDDPRFNLALYARNFHAVERRTLASLDVSTVGDSLRLTGSMDAAALTGTIRVDRGDVYLPERDLLRKEVIDLSRATDIFTILDSTDYRSRQILPDASSRLVENLRLDDVHIVLGDEVWLRSREANIKLGGSLDVRSAEKQASLNAASRGSRSKGPEYGFALSGRLTADRGTYTLDLAPAPVQREFTVEKGQITFYGSADYNPEVDITATHGVKRATQADLMIQVRLRGFLLPNPSIELSSTNEPYLSTSDLVSYLVTGQPTYALNSGDLSVVQQVSNVIGPTLSSFAENAARSAGFTLLDVLSIQSGAAPTTLQNNSSQSTIKDYFFGARLGGEKQLSNNLFFSFSAGLCSFNREYDKQNQTAFQNFTNALGGHIEYRFNPKLSLQVGTDPPTNALYCRSNYSLGSLVETPRQWGLSILRTWHF
jgi:translocation and assembly module TamB